MKVAFYVPGFEHLGIGYLSSCLKEAGHETVGFFDPLLCKEGLFHTKWLEKLVDMEEYVVERMLEARPDVFAFSVVTGNFARALRVAGKLKEHSNAPVVFGGIHCSSVPERVIEHREVDYVIVGEGEHALVELVDRLESGASCTDIAGLWCKADGRVHSSPPRPLVADLDSLPFPDTELVASEAPGFFKEFYYIMASRGCLFSCTYCNNSLMRRMYKGKGKWRRRRSVDNVIEELIQAKEKYHFRSVRFWDELFVDDREWLREFVEKYARAIAKPFFCWGHPRYIDQEIVDLLVQGGCRELNVGVESVQEETRVSLLRRRETNAMIINTFDLVRPTKIWLSTGNILGLPGQSVEEVAEMASFYNENRVDKPWTFFFRYYPNTDIVSLAKDRGYVLQSQIDEISDPRELESSFSHSTAQDDSNIVRLGTLTTMTTLFPVWFVRMLLKNERWRRIPAVNATPVITLISMFVKRIVHGKIAAKEGYTAFRYLHAILFFSIKKAAWKLKR